MRELYESVSHTEPQLPSSSLGLLGGDPFYDRYPWFRLIGRSAKQNYMYITLKREFTMDREISLLQYFHS